MATWKFKKEEEISRLKTLEKSITARITSMKELLNQLKVEELQILHYLQEKESSETATTSSTIAHSTYSSAFQSPKPESASKTSHAPKFNAESMDDADVINREILDLEPSNALSPNDDDDDMEEDDDKF